MPKIYISTDEWYPWYDYVAADEFYSTDESVEVTQEQLDRLDQLAVNVEEYHRTLARLINRNSIYDD